MPIIYDIFLYQEDNNSITTTIQKPLYIVTANAPYEEMIPIFKDSTDNSKIISSFCGQTCLTCNLFNKEEFSDNFIKVELSKNKIGYVKTKDVILDTISLDNFDLLPNENFRNKVCNKSLEFLTTSYEDISCNTLIRECFKEIG